MDMANSSPVASGMTSFVAILDTDELSADVGGEMRAGNEKLLRSCCRNGSGQN
jgi:hypothetical protein